MRKLLCPFCQNEVDIDTSNQLNECPHCNKIIDTNSAINYTQTYLNNVYKNATQYFESAYSFSEAYKYYKEFLKFEPKHLDAILSSLLSLLRTSTLKTNVFNQIINDFIENYNKINENDESKKITYTDYLGIMMSSISTIIDAISYVLIGFVSVSLVVSSIMIGIITYISVLERITEIGILRAVGASKKDISRVFNAETLIIGFVSGIIGIGATLLLTLPINLILSALAGIKNVASLPVAGAIILVGISMFLTFIAGLVPSSIAAKKDPVEALRSE